MITLCNNFRSTFGPTDVLTDSKSFCIAESEFLVKKEIKRVVRPIYEKTAKKAHFLRFFENKIEGNIFLSIRFFRTIVDI